MGHSKQTFTIPPLAILQQEKESHMPAKKHTQNECLVLYDADYIDRFSMVWVCIKLDDEKKDCFDCL